MAEGWCKFLKSDSIDSYSAGVDPHGINPLAIKVMREVGVNIANSRSKHVNDLKEIKFDSVVTVCDHAHETCPLLPGTTVVHIPFDDPPRLAKDCVLEEEALTHYRRVRDEIKNFVSQLPGVLGVQNA